MFIDTRDVTNGTQLMPVPGARPLKASFASGREIFFVIIMANMSGKNVRTASSAARRTLGGGLHSVSPLVAAHLNSRDQAALLLVARGFDCRPCAAEVATLANSARRAALELASNGVATPLKVHSIYHAGTPSDAAQGCLAASLNYVETPRLDPT